MIGLHRFELGKSHKAELGYWLAKPYWNQGVMTDAVKQGTEFAFNELKLIRIYAYVIDFNLGSEKVLEKSGYECEGVLHKNYQKNGSIFEGKILPNCSPQ